MIRVSHNYQQAAKAGYQEQLLSVWTTPRGRYVYSNFFPSQAIVDYFGGVYFWNGADLTLGSGQTWGGLPVCEYDQRILNPGSIKATLSPIKGNLLVSLGQTERGAIAIEYDNADDYFSELWGDQRNEPFLFQQHEIYHGFLGLDPEDFVKIAETEIQKLRYDDKKAVVYNIIQSKVYETIPEGETMTVYALANDDYADTMASKAFSHAALTPAFFSSDDWTFSCNCKITDADTFSESWLLQLKNSNGAITLAIGWGDAGEGDCLLVVTGQDVEGTPATTEYPDTYEFSADDLDTPLNITIQYSDTDSTLSFRVYGESRAIAATVPYDRTGTNNETVSVGFSVVGAILNVRFNDIFFLINNEGDDSLTAIPDVISGLDVTLDAGTWETW